MIVVVYVEGEYVLLVGQVFDGDNNVVGDVVFEFMQVDGVGCYFVLCDDIVIFGFMGFVWVGMGIDLQQCFVVEMVKLGCVVVDEVLYINVIVMMCGIFIYVFICVYFDDEVVVNVVDFVFNVVLFECCVMFVVKCDVQLGCLVVYCFDICMQGLEEIVFFDV